MYPDIDYINEIYYYAYEIVLKTRKRKNLNEDVVNEMIGITICLLDILQQYINDIDNN